MTNDLNKNNKARYESDKALQGLTEDGMNRIHIDRNQPGPRAKFVHDEYTGAYVVKPGHGGINWYRYQEKVLKPKLIPFALECENSRPGMWIQEDNTPSHNNRYSQEVFDFYRAQRLLWPGNSPDLNAIEPTQFWMKRETTKKGPITSQKELKEEWIKCWRDMSQEKIQA